MLAAMSVTKLLLIGVPIGHILIFGAYFLFSRDAAGTAMSVIFALAMGLMLYVLLPTIRDVGPTAPVDPAWSEAPQPHPHVERVEG